MSSWLGSLRHGQAGALHAERTLGEWPVRLYCAVFFGELAIKAMTLLPVDAPLAKFRAPRRRAWASSAVWSFAQLCEKY